MTQDVKDILQQENIFARIVNHLTQYDIKASKRKGYNPYALGLYIARVTDNVMPQLEAGKPLPDALRAGFSDRVLNAIETGLRADGIL